MMSVIEEEMPLVASNSHDQKLPVRESQRWLLRCSHLHDFHSFWSQCQITEIVCHWERREPPSQTNQRAFGKGLSWNVCFSVEHMPKLLSPKKNYAGPNTKLNPNHRQVAFVKQEDAAHSISAGVVHITKDASALGYYGNSNLATMAWMATWLPVPCIFPHYSS